MSEVSAPETRAPAPTSTVTTPIERVRHDFSWMITVGLVLAVFGALALWAKLGGKTSRLFAGLATAVVIGFIVLVTPVGLHYFVMDLSQATMETAIPSHVSPAASTTQARIVTVRFPNNVEIVPATIRPGQILFAQISPARQRNVQFCPVRDDADRHALQHLRGYQGTVTPVLNGVELKLRSEIEDYYRRVGKPIEFRVHLVSADNTAC